MRHLLVEYGDLTLAIVYPVPRCKLSLFELLSKKLYEVWFEKWKKLKEMGDCNSLLATQLLVTDVGGWQLIEAIARLLPSEKSLPFRTEPLKSDIELLQSLYLINFDDKGQQHESLLTGLHLFDPMPRRAKNPDEGLTIEDVPFPATGNSDADTIGNLIAAFGVGEGLRLWNTLDAEQLNKALHVWGELSRNPDDRLREFIVDEDQKAMAANPDVLKQALGLPSYYEFN